MENLTLFQKFVLWLLEKKQSFTITTGICYGHKIYKSGKYEFIEINEKEIVVSSDDFYIKVTTFEELIRIANAIQ